MWRVLYSEDPEGALSDRGAAAGSRKRGLSNVTAELAEVWSQPLRPHLNPVGTVILFLIGNMRQSDM